MAKKVTKKVTKTANFLTESEYKKFFDLIGKARVMAYKLSINDTKNSDVRKAFRSIEKRLFAIGNDYYWGRLTNK